MDAHLFTLLSGKCLALILFLLCPCHARSQYLQHQRDSLSINNSLQYNLETCKRILDVAGVRDYDDDGVLEFMSGSPQEIDLHFVVCADSSAKCGIARRFQEDMASIGLTVTVRELTWDEYLTALEEGDFDMYYGEVKLRNNFDLTELMQVRTKDSPTSNINWSRSRDTTIVDRINNYLRATDAARPIAYNELCEYLTRTSGNLVSIGFEKQQLITHRGVVKGVAPNIGNPLYDFQNWSINLED